MTKKDPDFKSEHKLVVPGLPEVGKAIEGVADETINQSVKGFRKTLGAIFGPASEQFGEAWADRVKQYRYLQHLKFVAKVQTKHQELGIDENYRIKPRLMVDLIENSSLEDDSDMQEWWAGLSISSLEDVPSDDNLIFINMMKQITSTQRKIIEYMCANAEIKHTPNNLIVSSYFMVSRKDLVKEIGVGDIDKLDREIDSLGSLGLLHGIGFDIHSDASTIDLTPSPLCLHFYSRCNGRTTDLIGFLGAELTEKCPNCGRIHDYQS